MESMAKLKSDKQQKKAGNITERGKWWMERKLAERVKKLMRPGIECRKVVYINGD